MDKVLDTGFILHPKSHPPNTERYTLPFNHAQFTLRQNFRLTPTIIYHDLYCKENWGEEKTKQSQEDVRENNFFEYLSSSFFPANNTHEKNEAEQKKMGNLWDKNFKYFIKLEKDDTTAAGYCSEIKVRSGGRYRYHRNYQSLDEIDKNKDIENIYMNLVSNYFWENDKGQKCFSLFPPEIIKFFRKHYEITDKDVKQNTILTKHPENILFEKQRNRHNSITFRKNTPWMSNHCYSDLNFIKKLENLEGKISIIEFKNCSKGTTPIRYKFVTKLTETVNDKQTIFITKKKIILYTWNKDNTDIIPFEAFYYSFGTFSSLVYLSKYKKFRTYFLDFLLKIQLYNGAYLLDKEEYEKRKEEQHKHYIKYWKRLPSCFNTFVDSDYDNIEKNNDYYDYDKILAKESIASLGAVSSVSLVKEYAAYKDLSTTINKMKEDLSLNPRNITKEEDAIGYYDRQLISFNEQILNFQKKVKNSKNLLKKYKGISKHFPEQIGNLEKEIIIHKSDYQLAITNKLKDKSLSQIGFNFIEDLKNKEIIIDKISYWDSTKQAIVSLCSDPTLALRAKQHSIENSSNWNNKDYDHLCEISFRILKPIIIRVDYNEKLEKCHKIVGGPYCVELTSNSLRIGLLTTNSIFGYNKSDNNLWIHPHTPAIHLGSVTAYNLKKRMLDIKNACLGEASSAFYKAFESADPRHAVYAAMSWITSANSSDAWGKHWKYFPSFEDINLSSERVDILLKENLLRKTLQNSEDIIENFFPEIETVQPPNFLDDEVVALIANERDEGRDTTPLDCYENETTQETNEELCNLAEEIVANSPIAETVIADLNTIPQAEQANTTVENNRVGNIGYVPLTQIRNETRRE